MVDVLRFEAHHPRRAPQVVAVEEEEGPLLAPHLSEREEKIIMAASTSRPQHATLSSSSAAPLSASSAATAAVVDNRNHNGGGGGATNGGGGGVGFGVMTSGNSSTMGSKTPREIELEDRLARVEAALDTLVGELQTIRTIKAAEVAKAATMTTTTNVVDATTTQVQQHPQATPVPPHSNGMVSSNSPSTTMVFPPRSPGTPGRRRIRRLSGRRQSSQQQHQCGPVGPELLLVGNDDGESDDFMENGGGGDRSKSMYLPTFPLAVDDAPGSSTLGRRGDRMRRQSSMGAIVGCSSGEHPNIGSSHGGGTGGGRRKKRHPKKRISRRTQSTGNLMDLEYSSASLTATTTRNTRSASSGGASSSSGGGGDSGSRRRSPPSASRRRQRQLLPSSAPSTPLSERRRTVLSRSVTEEEEVLAGDGNGSAAGCAVVPPSTMKHDINNNSNDIMNGDSSDRPPPFVPDLKREGVNSEEPPPVPGSPHDDDKEQKKKLDEDTSNSGNAPPNATNLTAPQPPLSPGCADMEEQYESPGGGSSSSSSSGSSSAGGSSPTSPPPAVEYRCFSDAHVEELRRRSNSLSESEGSVAIGLSRKKHKLNNNNNVVVMESSSSSSEKKAVPLLFPHHPPLQPHKTKNRLQHVQATAVATAQQLQQQQQQQVTPHVAVVPNMQGNPSGGQQLRQRKNGTVVPLVAPAATTTTSNNGGGRRSPARLPLTALDVLSKDNGVGGGAGATIGPSPTSSKTVISPVHSMMSVHPPASTSSSSLSNNSGTASKKAAGGGMKLTTLPANAASVVGGVGGGPQRPPGLPRPSSSGSVPTAVVPPSPSNGKAAVVTGGDAGAINAGASATSQQQQPHQPPAIASSSPAMKPLPKILDYVKVEMLGDKAEGSPEKDCDRNMEEFLRVPSRLESLLVLGLVVCTDSYLNVLAILPLKVGAGFVNLFWTVVKRQKNTHFRFHRRNLYQILQTLIIVTVYGMLLQISVGMLYHWIRGQTMLKLYLVMAIVEVFDRLMCSFGQDALDSLYWNTTRRPYHPRMFVSFVVVLVYVFFHSLILFVHIATLNVAMNSADQALLSLLIGGNFAEIKSTVFKKYNKQNLFNITTSDICERFKLVLFMFLILLLNFFQGGNSFKIVKAFVDMSLLVFASEVLCDWIKHSFITKFNSIRSSVYQDYSLIIAGDVTGIGHINHVNLDHTHAVVKRVGLAQIPLVCVMLRYLREALRYSYIQYGDTRTVLQGIVLIFVLLLVVKVVLGMVLEWWAARILEREKDRRDDSPRLSPADPPKKPKRPVV